MEKNGVVHACPFPPGAHKPRVDHVPRRWRRTLRQSVVTLRSVSLVLVFLSVTYLYVNSYGLINTTGKPVLFRDNFIVLLSLGSYVAAMLMWYIRRWKIGRRRRER
jgi:hypothetical protein